LTNETKQLFCGPGRPVCVRGLNTFSLIFEANERNKIKILLRSRCVIKQNSLYIFKQISKID